MTMRDRLPANSADAVDLAATLELLASLAQYAEAGAVQPDLLSRAAQHAVDQHGGRIEVLLAVGKLYLAAGDRGAATQVLGKAGRLAPEDLRVTQLLADAGIDVGARAPLSSRDWTTPGAGMRAPFGSDPRTAGDTPDTRIRRREPSSPSLTPPKGTPAAVPPEPRRDRTLPSMRPLALALRNELEGDGTPAAPVGDGTPAAPVGDGTPAAPVKGKEPSEPNTPRSAGVADGPLLRPTVRMARVAAAPERPRWGKPGGENRDAPESTRELEPPSSRVPRSAGARPAVEPAGPAAAAAKAVREAARNARAATGNLKLLDPNDERRYLDRYELIGEIASGGMASVFLARLAGVAGFQRFFAIKRLHPHLADEQEFIDMFLDEARLAAGIHHPNVVPILEVGTTEAGYYLVMDYIEGDTLSGVVARAATSGGLPRAMALRIILDALHGLQAAHELSDSEGRLVDLVHRDCSPQNILVGIDGSSRITDFGVARASSRLSTTRSATVKGKLAYLSPEQATSRELDRRSDIFGMGVILWEVLAGRRLFRADSDGATLSRILVEPIPPVSLFAKDLPDSVVAVVSSALARDPADRFPTAADMADTLEYAIRDAGSPSLTIASPREVSTYMRDLFGAEITSRRDAVRTWTANTVESPSSSGPRSQGFRRSLTSSPELAGSGSPVPSSSRVEPPSSRTEPSVSNVAEPAPERRPLPIEIVPPREAVIAETPAPEAAVDPPLPAAASLLQPAPSLAVAPAASATKRPPPALLALAVVVVLVVLAILAYVLRSGSAPPGGSLPPSLPSAALTAVA